VDFFWTALMSSEESCAILRDLRVWKEARHQDEHILEWFTEKLEKFHSKMI